MIFVERTGHKAKITHDPDEGDMHCWWCNCHGTIMAVGLFEGQIEKDIYLGDCWSAWDTLEHCLRDWRIHVAVCTGELQDVSQWEVLRRMRWGVSPVVPLPVAPERSRLSS